jgi:hypothetical protein
MILYEIRTALCDYNVKRSLNTGITPLILPCRRGDGVARPETSVDRSFGLCYTPARLGLELGKIAVAIVIARTLDNLKIIRADRSTGVAPVAIIWFTRSSLSL